MFRNVSKLSGNIFWTSWDHLVAQKDDFTKKKSKKVAPPVTLPLVTYCFTEKMGGSLNFGQMWSKKAKLVELQVPITFFLLIGWRRPTYEKYSKFYELFEKQHRGTQKSNKNNTLGTLGFALKSGQKAILNTPIFLGQVTL